MNSMDLELDNLDKSITYFEMLMHFNKEYPLI